jgi:hypothetical protein
MGGLSNTLMPMVDGSLLAWQYHHQHTYEISLWHHYLLGTTIVVFSLNTIMGFDVAVVDVAVADVAVADVAVANVAVVVVHVLSTPDTRFRVI